MSEYHLEIDGIDIKFPHVPYEVQKIYMSKVIECLQKGVNGLLESPTGTGKTLSLLCSSLAWLKHRQATLEQAAFMPSSDARDILNISHLFNTENTATVGRNGPNFAFLPKIIYSSRTHSQLSQVVQELKRSSYNNVSAIVLGSRDQLCLHPEVSKLHSNSAKLNSCKNKVTNHTCPFNLNLDNKLVSKDYQDNSILDIEDLIVAGKKNTCCPYYAAKSLKSRADIIFTPYNYLVDPKTRRTHGIEITKNVIIFDEAHNIENVCEDSMSFQLRSSDLARCITEITQAIEYIKDREIVGQFNSNSENTEFTLSDLSILKVMFCELEEKLDKEISNLTEGSAKPASFVFDLFASVGLTAQKKEVVLDLLDKIILHLTMEIATSSWVTKGAGLQCFSDLIRIMFSNSAVLNQSLVKSFNEKYRVYLSPDDSQNITTFKKSPKKGWTLYYWCFSPELSMMDLIQQGVHSLILTSGTLSPLNSFAAELGISFPVTLENPHIIDDDQVFIGVLKQGPDGTNLNSSYQNRSNVQYINSLGRTLINLGRMVPDGMLVFFPSYSVLRSSVAKWEESGIWNSLSTVKSIFIEPQGKIAFQEGITQYYEKIETADSSGAILFAVCRGKVSEGLDFSDKNARAVFITGLPFPPCQDPRVKLKMSYLNEFCKEKGLSGNEWYLLQASRVVNQAVGRVIRHRNDYGAILFCDNRFSEKRIYSQLSMWLQGRIKIFNSFGSALKEMSGFFRKIEQTSFTKLQNQTASFISSSRKIVVTPVCHSKSKTITDKSDISNNYNIIQGYLPDNDTKEKLSESSKHSNSIFDALENMAASSSSNFEDNLEVKSKKDNSESKCDDIPKTSVKRRKINVGLHDINGKNESTIDKREDSMLREKWKNRLQEVKRILNFTNSYPKFCQVVKEYKNDKNISNFAKDISVLFINIPERENLLNIIVPLVSCEQRNDFINLCKTNFKIERNDSDMSVENDSLLQVSNKNSMKKFCGQAYTCAYCENIATVPMMAFCGHVCCFLCWKNIRKKIRFCPICKCTKIKKRDLRQLYFKSCVSSA
ncbi:regulator of telomere elongation helicase 1 homolog isoform X2 [Centruroides sculpturatus]|uniref:regulator of telomere elongation helicase 1 homolog isoform X2 n=1 Tax=Centruroides sculpturatus TaxID=218467 RepID=UPI000C6CE8FC|nr:regulator of telomere elongation helicase 1 homolog isoform X2 [Centruroides sculpturatus]